MFLFESRTHTYLLDAGCRDTCVLASPKHRGGLLGGQGVVVECGLWLMLGCTPLSWFVLSPGGISFVFIVSRSSSTLSWQV